jgi:hypothetical protein
MIKTPPTHKIRSLLAGCFGQKKRTFCLKEQGGEINVASYWDGGSRDFYKVVNMATGEERNPLRDFSLDKRELRNLYITLGADEILVNHGYSQGKLFSPYFICAPGQMEKMKKFLGVV